MQFAPMLASNGSEDDLDKQGFIYEPKLDGIRAICMKDGKGLHFFNRRKQDISASYPEFDFVENIKAKQAVIDGEIILTNEKGVPDFQALMARHLRKASRISKQRKPAHFIAYDILSINGKSLIDKPLTERKKKLHSIIETNNILEESIYTTEGRKLWNLMLKREMEGVIAKKEKSFYAPGTRSVDWLKIKAFKTLDCIIVGYFQDKLNLSSIAVGAYEKGEIRFLGRVGTGFKDKQRTEIYDMLKGSEIDKPDFEFPVEYAGTTWTQPKYVCEVKYLEIGSQGMLRNPVFLRLRDDKPMEDCIF